MSRFSHVPFVYMKNSVTKQCLLNTDIFTFRSRECNENLQKECDVLVKEAKEETRLVQEKLNLCSASVESQWQEKLQGVQDELQLQKQNSEKSLIALKEQLSKKEGEFEIYAKEKGVEVCALTQDVDRLKEELRDVEQQKLELESRLNVEKELLQTGENRLSLVEQELNKVKESLVQLNENKETLQQDLQKAREIHEKEVEVLKENFQGQLQAELDRLKAAQNDAESYKKLMEDKSVLLEEKTKEVENLESKRVEDIEKCKREGEEKYQTAVESYESELQTTRTELTLEHEVEMEKVCFCCVIFQP